MKRDMELIHKILFELQKRNYVPASAHALVIPDYDDRAIVYHLKLLADTQLVALEGHPASYYRLTSQGHDFVEAIQDDTFLQRTKDTAQTTILALLKIAMEQGVQFGLQELRRVGGYP